MVFPPLTDAATAEHVPGAAPAQRVRRWRGISLRLAALALVALLLAEPLRLLLGYNLHAVVPGQVYRAAQPAPGWLRAFARANGIQTIVNLRGTCYPQDWYLEEASIVQELGISLEDVCLSAGRLPSPHELRQLALVIENARRPLLMHCRHGADRTGLASAIVLLLEQDMPLQTAQAQLSLRFGHLAMGRVNILNRFFDFYAAWLERAEQTHSSATFRHWLLNEYRGGLCQYEMEEVTRITPPPRVGRPIGYRVRVRNSSEQAWHFKPGSTAGVHLGYFLSPIDESNAPLNDTVEVVRATLLDRVVQPGETFTATVVVKPLPYPGRFRLRIDMVEEGHCWFYQTGAEPYDEEFEVAE
jgi:protein tyrosine/serine phosphatase